MSPSQTYSCFLLYGLSLLLISKDGHGTTLRLVNKCDFSIWPGLVNRYRNSSQLDTTGFELAKGSSGFFTAPSNWRGRIWGRTGCNFDGSGQGSCATGDCGSGKIECNGTAATPPVTLAEFGLAQVGSLDFYDVSLVDGYNLPMIVEGTGDSGECPTAGCKSDLNPICPKELRVGDGVACNSACAAFGRPEYCCSGAYRSPDTCKPSMYSQIFKRACPRAYSYAFDDADGSFSCSTGADYTITFCPNITSLKSPNITSLKSAGSKKRFVVPAIASALSVAVFLVISCVLLLFRRIIRKEDANGHLQEGGLIESGKQQVGYNEVLQITRNLKTIIGEGGFGKVYLGELTNGNKVAVKLLAETSKQGHKEFQAEAQLLNVNHKNLVSLVGYCHDGGNMALIYEYMANGSLRQHLSEATTEVLSWNQRLQIAVDAAQGLEYLHNGCKPPIVHRDLKPSNILLDENMKAKIADFGLSRAFSTESTTHVITRIAGTIGYMDPEFHVTGNLSKASDVYSFGIILFELITGRSAIIKGAEVSISILDWVKPLINEGDIQKIIDPLLHGKFNINSAWKAIEIAKSSTMNPGIQRPNMSTILVELKQCMAIQLGSDNDHGVEGNSTYLSITDGGACLDAEAFSLVSAR